MLPASRKAGTLPLTFLYTAAGSAIEWDLRAALWLAIPVLVGVFALPRLLERIGAPLGRWVHPEGYEP